MFIFSSLLALRVEAGAEDQSFESNSMFTLFGIDILLTEKGYECIEKVLEAIFSAILLLKETSIDEHKRAFEELQQINDTQFDYREEQSSSDNTEEYAVNMHYYNSQDIITGPRKYFEFDAQMVSKLIDLLNEGKFNLLLLTDKHDRYRCVEKWFGTEYDEMGEIWMRK
jgi:secreted Zn-dependent insulinase-like peptidase